MKVFAHYYKSEETRNDYRWRTLLQFGTSWEIIGSVVMKNPGSAAPIRLVDNQDTLIHLRSFCSKYDWFLFSGDNTMQNIEKLFRTYYYSKFGEQTLNGVVQIFNLMNVRDPNLEIALIKNKKDTLSLSKTTELDIQQLAAPVYLGWGNLGFNPAFREDAEKIFKIVRNQLDGEYLFPKFDDNKFYHPQWLMGRGKNHSNSQFLLNVFCQNTQTPTYNNVIIPQLIISKEIVFQKVLERLYGFLTVKEESPKTCRFQLSDELVVTITCSESGYIGIRHSSYKEKYSNADYPHTSEYCQIMKQHEFGTSFNVWLGKKAFKDYGNKDNEIIEGICKEIKELKEEIQKM